MAALEPRPLQSPPSPCLAIKAPWRLARSWRNPERGGGQGDSAGELKKQHASAGRSLVAHHLRLQPQFAFVSRRLGSPPAPAELLGPSSRCDGAPAHEGARRSSPSASALALCATQGRGTSSPPASSRVAAALWGPGSALLKRLAPGAMAAQLDALCCPCVRVFWGSGGMGVGEQEKFADFGFRSFVLFHRSSNPHQRWAWRVALSWAK